MKKSTATTCLVFVTILTILLSVVAVFAKAKIKESSDPVTRILSQYREAKLVEIKVEKTIKSEWKTKDQVFSGQMFYSKGKFRWENDIPEKNWTIYNGKTLWNIQFASPDFPGKNKVTKSVLTKKNRGQILLMSLLDIQDLSEKFKVQKEEPIQDHEKKILNVKLEPLEKDPAVSKLQLVLNLSSGNIQSLSFQDDIGNLTTVTFKDIQFQKEKKNKLFDYIQTKNDEVTEI